MDIAIFIQKEPSLPIWAWRLCKVCGGKGSPNEFMNKLMTEVFIAQPLASPGSADYIDMARTYLINSGQVIFILLAKQENTCTFALSLLTIRYTYVL